MVEITFSFSRYRTVTQPVSDAVFYRMLQVLEEEPGVDTTLADIERWHIERVLDRSETLQDAARTLGVSKRCLWDRRKLYNHA